ncbi:MAG TPA: hypothetical protein VFJ51_05435 [Nitrososphaeraceae archaeon]|nr:hypothetical protein [Nitrososphaeraceae archaeon]
MKVRVYFYKEPDIQAVIMKEQKISRQALGTIYDLIWESEFKNILNVGRIWLKFTEQDKPFGIPLREKRSHDKIAAGDIIQIASDFYMVDQIGARKIDLID